jgi:hypothetical protein
MASTSVLNRTFALADRSRSGYRASFGFASLRVGRLVAASLLNRTFALADRSRSGYRASFGFASLRVGRLVAASLPRPLYARMAGEGKPPARRLSGGVSAPAPAR